MTAQQLAVWIASIIDAPLTQFIKKQLGWAGWKALWLFFAVSFILAAIALFVTGELNIPAIVVDPVATIQSFLVAFMQIVGLATVLYKLFVDQPGVE